MIFKCNYLNIKFELNINITNNKMTTHTDFGVKLVKSKKESNSKLSKDYLEKNLNFDIIGDVNYGLDKSIVNGIRRTLLTDIQTVAFNETDIAINTNHGGLHNEFLKHRISLIPLYIDPTDYHRQYLFELKIKVSDDVPLVKVTAENFNIYKLKSENERLYLKQKDMDYIDDDANILLKLSTTVDTSYYDLDRPLSKTEVKKLFRPFVFNKTENYFLITELKNTNSVKENEEIELYCVPSIGTSKEHARFNNLSTVTYSFKKDQKLFNKVATDKLSIEKIKPANIQSFTRSLELSEGERYYFRDVRNEPYHYEFKLTSNHFYPPQIVFIQAIDILIGRFMGIIDNFNKILTNPKESLFSIERLKTDTTFKIIMLKEDDTTGNIIQAHAVNHHITSNSYIELVGYKKPHPLTDLIFMNIMVKPNSYNEDQKKTVIIQFLVAVVDDIIEIMKKIREKANTKL